MTNHGNRTTAKWHTCTMPAACRFQDGSDARYAGRPRDACPYTDLEGDAWRAGWDAVDTALAHARSFPGTVIADDTECFAGGVAIELIQQQTRNKSVDMLLRYRRELPQDRNCSRF